MRLNLIISKPQLIVPYAYREKLTGTIHKWLGENKFHDDMSFYSFSNLENGEASKDGLYFKGIVKWFISAYEEQFLGKLITGIKADSNLFYGMKVLEIQIQQEPDFSNIENFKIASPIFIKRLINDKEKHYTYEDIHSDQYMTNTLNKKLIKAGLTNEEIEIKFNRSYPKPQIKVFKYNNIGNKVSWCPIIMKGTNLAKQFAWNVGIGNSTGIGFGSIY